MGLARSLRALHLSGFAALFLQAARLAAMVAVNGWLEERQRKSMHSAAVTADLAASPPGTEWVIALAREDKVWATPIRVSRLQAAANRACAPVREFFPGDKKRTYFAGQAVTPTRRDQCQYPDQMPTAQYHL
jgi:hypothetical protein